MHDSVAAKPTGQMRRRVLAPHAIGDLLTVNTRRKIARRTARASGNAPLRRTIPSRDRHGGYLQCGRAAEVSGSLRGRSAGGVALQCRALGLSRTLDHQATKLRGSVEASVPVGRRLASRRVSQDNLVPTRQGEGAPFTWCSRQCGRPDVTRVSDAVDRVVAVKVAGCAPRLSPTIGASFAASHAGGRGDAADVAGVPVRALADCLRLAARCRPPSDVHRSCATR